MSWAPTLPLSETELPLGYRVEIRSDVVWHDLPAGKLLVGGSPLRATRLTERAVALFDDRVLAVSDAATAVLAGRLLDGNLADPLLGPPVAAADLTVVIPVRDRPQQLDRCLAALAGLDVIVVDDASREPDPVHEVARRHGARVVVLGSNLGPGGARNAGLVTVTRPLVAFVDSDVVVDPPTLLGLAAHLADPRTALVGPLVRGVSRSPRPCWYERYDVVAGSLALGEKAASIARGARVGWLPSACLVGRTSALRHARIGGFSAEMRVGEDVDLVWRLLEEGWRVRYDPAFEASHEARATLSSWLGRKFVYGSGGAALADRHGDAVAVARLSPLMATAGACVLLRRRWGLAVAVTAGVIAAAQIRGSLPVMNGRSRLAARLALQGLGWATAQQSSLMVRHWWPAAVAGASFSRPARRMMVSALVVDVVVAAAVDRPLRRPDSPPVGALALWCGRRLDAMAYGAGLWAGALRRRSLRCLAIEVVRRPGGRPASGRGAITRNARHTIFGGLRS